MCMRIERTDDFVADLGMPLQELAHREPSLSRSAKLCIIELQEAWSRAGWQGVDTFEFAPSERARSAWEAIW